MLKGGCCCGFVRYETGAEPRDPTNCHCSICRRASGAPFVAWFTVPKDEFRVLSGEIAQFRATNKATRGFCPRCGTALTFVFDGLPDRVDVTTCSLDEPDAVPPRDHLYTSTMVGWLKLADGLPRFPESRGKS